MKSTTKRVICFLAGFLAGLLLSSCAINTAVGPKPDVKPVMASNQAAQKNIAATRTNIKRARVDLKAGTVGLAAVDRYLEALLVLPEKERSVVLLARKELHGAMSSFARGVVKIAKADDRAAAAEDNLHQALEQIKTLGGEIDAAHKREADLAKDNAKMKPVYEACTSWWNTGIGAIIYGFKRLAKNLLFLGIGIVVIGGVLAGLAALGVPGLGFAMKGFRWVGSWIGRTVSRNKKHLNNG